MKNLAIFIILAALFMSGCAKRLVVQVPVSHDMTPAQIQAATVAAMEAAAKQQAADKKAKVAKMGEAAKTKTEEAKAKAAEKREEKISRTNEEWAKKQVRWKRQFGLRCPNGGYNDVVIHPTLGNQYLYWRGGGSMKVIFRRYVLVHRAKNPFENLTPDITNAGEFVVSCLCPGGSITLVASIDPLTGGNYQRVIWTAEAEVNGKAAFDESSPGILWQGFGNWEARANRPTWVMNFSRVDKRF